jgi:hypothetical protein
VVARTRHEPTALLVTFTRDAEPPDELHAHDGQHALRQAFALLARREFLLSGDALIVRRPDNEPSGAFVDLPEG